MKPTIQVTTNHQIHIIEQKLDCCTVSSPAHPKDSLAVRFGLCVDQSMCKKYFSGHMTLLDLNLNDLSNPKS